MTYSSITLNATYVQVHTWDKQSMTPTCRTSVHLQLCLIYFDIGVIRVNLEGTVFLASEINVMTSPIGVRGRATYWHIPSWMTIVRQLASRWYRDFLSIVLLLNTFYWWTRRKFQNQKITKPWKAFRGFMWILLFSIVSIILSWSASFWKCWFPQWRKI